MSESDKSHLLMLCGALHDVAEKTTDKIAAVKIFDIEMKVEKLVLLSMVDDIQDEINIISELVNELNETEIKNL